MSEVVFFGWLGVAVLLIWPLAVAILDEMRFGSPDGFDWAMSFFLGTCVAMLWPLAFLPALSWFIWNRVLRQRTDATQEVRR